MIAENGQDRTGFYLHLEHCCQRVSEAYGKPERAAWTNSDYVRLSRILFRQTSVQISPNTLKRIFGKIKTDSRYYPQKATRDALATYIGYADWEDFAQAQAIAALSPVSEVVAVPVQDPLPAGIPVRPNVGRRRRSWLVLVPALALMLLLFYWWKSPEKEAVPKNLVALTCINPEGETPHSASFRLAGLPDIVDNTARYLLDFGDGKHRWVDTTTHVYNHYYETPGRFFAVLKQGKRALDTATVFLPTRGWTATAYMMYDTTRVYPIELDGLFTDGKHRISAPEAARAGIDTNRTFFIEFVNTQKTAISGDNFELTARLKTSPTRTGVRCSQVGITVFGESSKHSFDVIKPGCVYWAKIQLSETYRTGQQEDLRFLGADLRAGGTVKLIVADQLARLFINGRQVYQARYQKPLHQVYGVGIRFAGIGTVDSFTLKDRRTGALFNGSF